MLRSFMESGKIWVVAVVGLLLLNISVCTVTVIAATSDPVAAAVEPEYYKRAVDWDKHRAEWPALSRHGWSLDIRDRGNGVVEIIATDASSKQSLVGMQGRVKAKHAGVTLETIEGELTTDESGRLLWTPGEISPGLWSVTVWLEQGEARAIGSLKVMIEG